MWTNKNATLAMADDRVGLDWYLLSATHSPMRAKMSPIQPICSARTRPTLSRVKALKKLPQSASVIQQDAINNCFDVSKPRSE